MPYSEIVIGGDSYDPDQRGDAGIVISRLVLNWDQADELAFFVDGCGPQPPYLSGPEVLLYYDSNLVFKGDLHSLGREPGEQGWQHNYRAISLMARSDWVTITGQDGTGQAVYNRAPNDLLYVASDAGLTLGTIFKRLLCIPDNAARLSAMGIGNYITLTPPTLPAATVADLLLLDVVPPKPVIFSGVGILNHMSQESAMWCPRFAMRIQPDGTIRFQDLFSLPRKTITVPTDFAAGDPVEAAISESTGGCYTAWKYIGVNVQPALLSAVKGTLAANWTMTDQTNWKYADFAEAKDRALKGDITALTSTSATIDPTSSTANFAANSLSAIQAQIYLENLGGTGIDLFEWRPITTNTALSAGGTCTVSWDAALPLDGTGYTKFSLIAQAGGLNEVWRGYLVREPASGATGLSTFVGSRLMPRFPRPISFANNGKIESITTPVAKVLWSETWAEPYLEYPMACEIDRAIGGVRFTEPAVKPTVTGGLDFLKTTGSPTNAAEGLPYDIQVIVPYNRGGIEARVPATGYQGTAYTVSGIERIMEIHADEWTWIGDKPDILKLADEHLRTVQDIVYDGGVGHFGLPSAFDVWSLGFAIDLVYPGPSSTELARFDNLPVRSITIDWQRVGIDYHVTMTFSNLRRPFQGDSLYVHPSFGGVTALDMDGQSPMGEWNSLVASKMGTPMVPYHSAESVAGDMVSEANANAIIPDYTAGIPDGPPVGGGINASRRTGTKPDEGAAIGPHAFTPGPANKMGARGDTLDFSKLFEPIDTTHVETSTGPNAMAAGPQGVTAKQMGQEMNLARLNAEPEPDRHDVTPGPKSPTVRPADTLEGFDPDPNDPYRRRRTP